MPLEKEAKIKKYRSILFELIESFLLVGLITLFFVGISSIYFSYNYQRNEIAEHLSLIARQGSEKVNNYIQSKADFLNSVIRINNLGDLSDAEKTVIFQKLFGAEPSYRQFVFINEQKQITNRIFKSADSKNFDITADKINELFLITEKKQIYISPVYIDNYSSEPVITMAVPVKNIFGDNKGLLAVEINLKYMWDVVGNLKVGQSGFAYVVDKQGNLIAFPDISPVIKGENLSYLQEVNKYVSGNIISDAQFFDIQKGVIGGYSAVEYAGLSITDWAVLVDLPIYEAYQPVIQEIKILLLMMLISIAISFFVSIILSKKIVKPIIKLKNIAAVVGQGKLNTKIEINSKNEIGELAEEFKQMISELKIAKEKNEKNRQNLEDEVGAKTKELQKIINEQQLDKQNLTNQGKAILNILEDVLESENDLKAMNDNLEKRSHELTSLKNLGVELSDILDVDIAVKTVNNYLSEAIKFPLATYLIINPYDDRDIIYKSCLNQQVDEKFIAAAKENLISFISENYEKNKDSIIKIINTINPQIVGAKLDNKSKANLRQNLFFPLRVGDKNLGVIYIVIENNKAVAAETKKLAEAIITNFSFAINHLYTLISTQHSKTVSLVKSLSDGVIMFNNKKEVVLLNQAVSGYFGFSKKYFNFDDLFRLFPEVKLREMIDESVTSGKISKIDEVGILNKFYEIIITPVSDNQQKIVGGAIIIHDISHIKQIDRMKTEFVSVASHQLRTPLTAIKLFTEMLMRGDVGELLKEQKEYLDNIYQSTDRMVRLVNDLLNVTRIESGRLKVDPQPTNLSDFIKSIITEAGPIATIKQVAIKYKTEDENLPEIPIDRNLIQQVIHNLLTNAIRYTPSGQNTVDVLLKTEKENYVISVVDHGIGIPLKAQSRMFEKFFRADNAVKAETEGTGLGLYVSKMLVESSGGKIWFKTEEGKGTTFFVSLPLKGMEKKKGERGLAISYTIKN